eukprot:scaffold462_cov195-Pinguiococcus_pyrenoidosus.AAC.40
MDLAVGLSLMVGVGHVPHDHAAQRRRRAAGAGRPVAGRVSQRSLLADGGPDEASHVVLPWRRVLRGRLAVVVGVPPRLRRQLPGGALVRALHVAHFGNGFRPAIRRAALPRPLRSLGPVSLGLQRILLQQRCPGRGVGGADLVKRAERAVRRLVFLPGRHAEGGHGGGGGRSAAVGVHQRRAAAPLVASGGRGALAIHSPTALALLHGPPLFGRRGVGPPASALVHGCLSLELSKLRLHLLLPRKPASSLQGATWSCRRAIGALATLSRDSRETQRQQEQSVRQLGETVGSC